MLKHKKRVTPGLVWGICTKGAKELDENNPNLVGAGILNATTVLTIANRYRKGRISYEEVVSDTPYSDKPLPVNTSQLHEDSHQSVWKYLAAAVVTGLILSIGSQLSTSEAQKLENESALEPERSAAITLCSNDTIDYEATLPARQWKSLTEEEEPVIALDERKPAAEEGKSLKLDSALQREWMEVTRRTRDNFQRAVAIADEYSSN